VAAGTGTGPPGKGLSPAVLFGSAGALVAVVALAGWLMAGSTGARDGSPAAKASAEAAAQVSQTQGTAGMKSPAGTSAPGAHAAEGLRSRTGNARSSAGAMDPRPASDQASVPVPGPSASASGFLRVEV